MSLMGWVLAAGVGVIALYIFGEREGWKGRAERFKTQLNKALSDLAEGIKPQGPYRMADGTVEPKEAEKPKPKIQILPYVNPRKAQCPACGDKWEWTEQRALCRCEKCATPHFHQKHWVGYNGEATQGCKYEWIVLSQLPKEEETYPPWHLKRLKG